MDLSHSTLRLVSTRVTAMGTVGGPLAAVDLATLALWDIKLPTYNLSCDDQYMELQILSPGDRDMVCPEGYEGQDNTGEVPSVILRP